MTALKKKKKSVQPTIQTKTKNKVCVHKAEESIILSQSVIWNYFGYKKDDIDQKPVPCRQCLASLATTRGNTTNVFDYLRRYHKAQYNACKDRSDCRPKKKKKYMISVVE